MMPKTPRHIRVFLSSPGDVKEERDAADRILEELPRGHAWKDKFSIDPVRWDDAHAPAPMDAHLTPQEAVNRSLSKPSQCDVVVVILWGRMGTPLPESYKKPDGTLYLSGTEWEFEDAQMTGRRILLYRRMEKPRIEIDDPDFAEKRKQFQLVQEFFKRFEGADGSLTGGYTSYQTVGEFEKRFRQDIEGLLRQLDEEEPKSGGHGRTARATTAPVTQTYRDWLKSECGGVELLGMRLRHGQAVRLNHIYVPVTTRWQLALDALEHGSLYLSGAPGSGKSTFCRWVAWLVSEGAMPTHEVNPPQEYAERFPGALRGYVPVLVRLRDFWRFLPRLPSGSDLSGSELEQALVRWLASRQPQGFAAEELRAHLERGTALLILDGIDEVPVSANGDRASWTPRSLLISGLKHGCPAWTEEKKGNRILLTSRPYGLTTGDTPRGLSPMPIEPLPDELQTLLMQRWFRVLADTEEAAQTTAHDMQAHFAEHRWLKPLTANPLLLTAMCIIYDEGKRLPQDKHDLYDRIIDTVLHGRYREPVAKDAARNRLGVIAHGMHTGEGLGEVRRTPQTEAIYAEIERMLKTYQARSPWTEAGYLGSVETREDLLSNSGLLLSSSEKRAQFYHLSFQEFLAAQRILDLADRSLLDVFCERAAAPEWRNTLSLLFGRVLGTSISPEKGINLMRDMIDAISPEAVGLQLVAADCIETLLAKGVRLAKDQESRLQQIFLRAMRSDAPAGDRASLGNTLARLGDPRFHVNAWYLPDEPLLGFVEIPEEPFLMGSKKGDPLVRKDELDQHLVTLPRYYVARYPVTVAQFQAFVQDSSDQPKGKDSLRGLSNHPVVNVSWHEARKYCEWLTERLREWKGTPEPLAILLRQEGWRVTLPSEAEWEKVARGAEGYIYPWGNDLDPNRANYSDTGINNTTAVGCFPEGVTPYGCLDMAGNVWEWTRSLWGEYPYPTEAKERAQREDLSARGNRVLRGGAFDDVAYSVRCAYRLNFDPDSRYFNHGFRVVVSPFFSER